MQISSSLIYLGSSVYPHSREIHELIMCAYTLNFNTCWVLLRRGFHGLKCNHMSVIYIHMLMNTDHIPISPLLVLYSTFLQSQSKKLLNSIKNGIFQFCIFQKLNKTETSPYICKVDEKQSLKCYRSEFFCFFNFEKLFFSAFWKTEFFR